MKESAPKKREASGRKSFRLVSKARLRKGLVRSASASDGIVDLAAAAELGLIENAGLVALLPEETRIRARRLLKANTVLLVTPKATSRDGRHRKSVARALVSEALSTVIGPQYAREMERAGGSPSRWLRANCFAKWVKTQIEDGGSELNRKLTRHGYAEISGLVRGIQWWQRSLQE